MAYWSKDHFMEIQKKTEGESLLNEIRFLNSLKYF